MLADFDRIVPGLARTIVDRAEIDMQHRHEMEKQALTAQIDDRKTIHKIRSQSQWISFILAIVFSSFGVYLVVNGHPKTGGTMATITVVALVGVFLTGQLIRPKQSTTKQEETES